jgi:hypothetical protein
LLIGVEWMKRPQPPAARAVETAKNVMYKFRQWWNMLIVGSFIGLGRARPDAVAHEVVLFEPALLSETGVL